jgi:uncharacterized membrane protein YhhN
VNWPVLGAAGLLMAADWVVVWRCWWRADYFFKPAAMLALIAWFWLAAPITGPAAWFMAGLVLSLLGDVFLMLPANLFMAGLAAFLLGHLAYVAGFNPAPPPPTWGALPILVIPLLAAAWLYRRISAGLARRKSGPVLRWGVTVYSLALTLMALSASLTLVRPEWGLRPAAIAALGGLFFFASDATLALDRFVAPIPHGRLLVRITYHLGQLGLILGFAYHVLPA